MAVPKIVGRAKASSRGMYRRPNGEYFFVAEGETFDLTEGFTKSQWFTKLDEEQRKARGPKAAKNAPSGPAEEDGQDESAGDIA